MKEKELQPPEFDYCDKHDTCFVKGEGCEYCREEFEDDVYDDFASEG